jgi:alkyl hydroperoxide reductase subunit AhpF
MNDNLYDLVIIGASAAGCAASIYASRRGLKFVVVTHDIGGEVALSGEVENWPGIQNITGIELAKNFEEHMKSYEAEIENAMDVTAITQDGNIHMVTAKDGSGKEKTYHSKAIIISSGIHPRELDVPGEKKLRNMGITYCTVCDGPLFKNKITATVGAGNSAVESALMMGTLASKVYLLTKYPESEMGGFPKAEDILVKKLKQLETVEIIYSAKTTEIKGEGLVKSLIYQDEAGKTQEIETNAVMIHIGQIPNSTFVDCVEKTKAGEIVVQLNTETSCRGVFSAGDVTTIPFKQIAIAAGQGVTAALSAIDYINKWEE